MGQHTRRTIWTKVDDSDVQGLVGDGQGVSSWDPTPRMKPATENLIGGFGDRENCRKLDVC